jgi:riboflavin kinase/FMN adenylyltransferase
MWQTAMPLIEVHLFDFDRDIYGEIINTTLIAYLRPEMKFSGVPELIRQIETDCINARSFL